MKTTSHLLLVFATVLSFAGAGIGLFTKFTGLPLIFAALYILDRVDNSFHILPKQKVWRYLWICLGMVLTLIELREVLTA